MTSLDVDAVEVVAAEAGVALGAFALPGLVPCLDALDAEHVEALGEDGVLVVHVAAGAAQLGLWKGESVILGGHCSLLIDYTLARCRSALCCPYNNGYGIAIRAVRNVQVLLCLNMAGFIV